MGYYLRSMQLSMAVKDGLQLAELRKSKNEIMLLHDSLFSPISTGRSDASERPGS